MMYRYVMMIICWMIIHRPYSGTFFFFNIKYNITEASFPYNAKVDFTSIKQYFFHTDATWNQLFENSSHTILTLIHFLINFLAQTTSPLPYVPAHEDPFNYLWFKSLSKKKKKNYDLSQNLTIIITKSQYRTSQYPYHERERGAICVTFFFFFFFFNNAAMWPGSIIKVTWSIYIIKSP